MRIKAILAVISFLVIAAPAHAIQMIDFETPHPIGLSPVAFYHSGAVPTNTVITDHYSSQGVLFQSTALVDLGLGHATSGYYGIGGIDSGGNLSYAAPVTFTFVAPTNSSVVAYTDYFSIKTDNWGDSGNTITISGYDVYGNLLGSTSHIEGAGGYTLVLQGIGNIHRVQIFESSHVNGMSLDDMTFADVVVPEPATLLLIGTGLAGMAYARRSRGAK